MSKLKHYRFERDYSLMGDTKTIKLIEFEILRKTDCGFWIKSKYDKERFVLSDSRKRYAYPTKEEAFNNFRIRTSKSYSYSVANLRNAIEFIELVNSHELIQNPIIVKKLNIKEVGNG